MGARQGGQDGRRPSLSVTGRRLGVASRDQRLELEEALLAIPLTFIKSSIFSNDSFFGNTLRVGRRGRRTGTLVAFGARISHYQPVAAKVLERGRARLKRQKEEVLETSTLSEYRSRNTFIHSGLQMAAPRTGGHLGPKRELSEAHATGRNERNKRFC